MKKVCNKCEGTGSVSFKHIKGGICFRCNGRGYFTQTAAQAAEDAREQVQAASYESQRELDPVYEMQPGDKAQGFDGALYLITGTQDGQYIARNQENGKEIRAGIDSEFLQPCSR